MRMAYQPLQLGASGRQDRRARRNKLPKTAQLPITCCDMFSYVRWQVQNSSEVRKRPVKYLLAATAPRELPSL